MPKLSKKKVLKLIDEEGRSSRMYRKAGYPGIARDEQKHRTILMRSLRNKRR
jgi:hypothetical protein